MLLKKYLLFSLILISFFGCKTDTSPKKTSKKSDLKYANGFIIENHGDYKKLTIKAPYKNADRDYEFLLVQKGKTTPEYSDDVIVIKVPIEKIVVTSTTHIPVLELLNVEKHLVGFPHTDYVSSEKTRKLIENGNIRELGNEQSINTEILLDLQPELVVSFGVINTNKTYSTIQKTGIPIILNGDWLEETPLGRAEWGKG